ncbi:hypothetical protein TA3x_005433 [Tundrisphaera sp. TA3]|uniref:hypothetical protein n=1 Tax=Tundrisphaera sp. TA3 TaxID=3435775 RepID=UPI003EB862C6
MLLGPVFRSELVRTARRRIDYWLRVLYGVILLAVVGLGYMEMFSAGGGTATIGTVSAFAQFTFRVFAIVQLVTVLLLVPAFFGGTIVDEKQRKTLHYLIASGLTSGEIVVDKTLGKLPRVAVYLAIGLPIIALLGLFGGVDPALVLAAYGGTISSMAFAVALSVFLSTLARRVRSAVLAAYVATAAWIIGPVLAYGVWFGLYRPSFARWSPWFAWAWPISPFYCYIEWQIRTMGAGTISPAIDLFTQMVVLQLAGAVLLMLASALLLRPMFRRHEGGAVRRSRPSARAPKGRRRWKAVPPCGDDAVAWKERHFARTDRFTRFAVLPATIVLTTFLILMSGLDETLLRMMRGLVGGAGAWDKSAVVEQVRGISIWYVAIWLLAVAGASASSVAVEREEDTWLTLTSTPLAGREILRGKAIGALWAQRGFGVFLLLIWAVGLLAGALHPLGVLMASAVLALETWLVAAIGVHASMRSATTSKALGKTLAAVFVLAGYPLFILAAFQGARLGDTATPFVGLMARCVVAPLVSWTYAANALTIFRGGLDMSRVYVWAGEIYLVLCLLLVHVAVAAFLTERTFARFDRWLDRPRGGDRA